MVMEESGAVQKVIAGVTGLAVTAVFGLIARFQQVRIKEIDEKKVDKDLYNANIESFSKELARGTKKFEKVEKDIDKIKTVTSTQETTLKLMQQQVGFLAKGKGWTEPKEEEG